jgi:hypothetical protein
LDRLPIQSSFYFLFLFLEDQQLPPFSFPSAIPSPISYDDISASALASSPGYFVSLN